MGLFIFWQKLGWLPGTGYVPFSVNPYDWFMHMILPWTVLALLYAAYYARMVRGNLIETMGEDYIRTSRAKGLSERRVVFHAGPAEIGSPRQAVASARRRRSSDASWRSPASPARRSPSLE